MPKFFDLPHSPRRTCQLLAQAVLVVGLMAAGWVYLTADPGTSGVLGYDGMNGQAYAVSPTDSKAYLRSMEMYGGKANLLAEQLRLGFASLWEGRTLAVTLAGLSLAVALFLRFTASRFPLDTPEQTRADKPQ